MGKLMKKYKIEVIETLARVVTIYAESVEEAYSEANKLYQQEEIILVYTDHIDTKFKEFIE